MNFHQDSDTLEPRARQRFSDRDRVLYEGLRVLALRSETGVIFVLLVLSSIQEAKVLAFVTELQRHVRSNNYWRTLITNSDTQLGLHIMDRRKTESMTFFFKKSQRSHVHEN